MSVPVLALTGLILCFFGTLSVRVAVVVAGFGAGWMLCDALDASTTTSLVVALSAAVIAFVVTWVISRFLIFTAGFVVGAVLGTKLFVLADGGDGDWVLALVFVPAVAFLCAFLGQQWKSTFLSWGTACAGALLLLSGLGRIRAGATDELWRPETPGGTIVLFALTVVLTVAGHHVQRRRLTHA